VRIGKKSARAFSVLALGAFVAATAATTLAQQRTVSVASVVQALENHYRNANTLQAEFLERYSEGGSQARLESGRVYFARLGRMRWEYQSPETKLFVSDGKTLWFYVPEDHTATRQSVKQSDDWRTPLALLTGQVKLAHLCGRIEMAGGAPLSGGVVVLRCWPRGEASPAANHAGQQDAPSPLNPGSGFTEVFLEVNPTSGELSEVRVEQAGDVELEFRFGAWQMNPPLPGSLFEFEPPVGVAIVAGDDSPDSAP
jgi:outer membrane lipoprotein-sorting protein